MSNQTRMSSSVNHTDQCEEEGCHQTVRYHLEDSPVHRRLIHHQQREYYHTAVRYRRVRVDVFQVRLHDGRVSPVNDADAREDDEYP